MQSPHATSGPLQVLHMGAAAQVRGAARYPVVRHLGGDALALAEQAQQEVLGANVVYGCLLAD
jgi:hypothetical protein